MTYATTVIGDHRNYRARNMGFVTKILVSTMLALGTVTTSTIVIGSVLTALF